MNASLTCSKKPDSTSKDTETISSVFLGTSLEMFVVKFYQFNWVHPGIEK